MRTRHRLTDELNASRQKIVDAAVEEKQAVFLKGQDEASFIGLNSKKQDHVWFLVEPDSAGLATWDAITSMTLLFIAVFTPIEVGFLPAPTKAESSLFILGRCIDAIFVLDMFVQCVVMVPKLEAPEQLETRWGAIVWRYMAGWFLLDLFSLGASAFDIIPLILGTADGRKSPVASFRILRVLRLVKLVRLLKASRRLKEWSVKIAWPRAVVTIFSTLVESGFVIHLVACCFGIVAIIPESPLDTWLATHGYCRPAGLTADGIRLHECRPPELLYIQCVWWAGGMLLGAPISLSPNNGPFPEHFSGLANDGVTVLDPDHMTKLSLLETVIIFVLKTLTAFKWVTVIARFVQVYNNLDPDARDFRMGWDALNRFVTYFKVSRTDARELRRYYIERAEEARAKSRKSVINGFSPFLQEKYVWKLNKEWLMKVPCFSLVVERLVLNPDDSGMGAPSSHCQPAHYASLAPRPPRTSHHTSLTPCLQSTPLPISARFLVKVALAVQPAVFVPHERPPSQRLYVITEGCALHRGRQIRKGDSWGADDVLIGGSLWRKHAYRALATTYLHVVWIGAETFDRLRVEHRDAYMLVKLWATINAAGRVVLAARNKERKAQGAIKIGNGLNQVSVFEIERRINAGLCKVVALYSDDGKRLFNAAGLPTFGFKYGSLDLTGYEITRESNPRSRRVGPSTPPSISTTQTTAGNASDLKSDRMGRRRNSVFGALGPQIGIATYTSKHVYRVRSIDRNTYLEHKKHPFDPKPEKSINSTFASERTSRVSSAFAQLAEEATCHNQLAGGSSGELPGECASGGSASGGCASGGSASGGSASWGCASAGDCASGGCASGGCASGDSSAATQGYTTPSGVAALSSQLASLTSAFKANTELMGAQLQVLATQVGVLQQASGDSGDKSFVPERNLQVLEA